MRFRTFPKIPTHRAAPPRAMGGPWVALEKLHGAQLVVAVSGGEVRVGKRKAWLEAEEPFFGWQLLGQELMEQARAVAAGTAAHTTVLYGELIGGGYPHPDVAPVPGLSPVQTGIWYTPLLAWVAFDALVATSEDDAGELLAHRELEELTSAAGLRAPPLVARRTRAELERLEVRFATRVPAWFGLPTLADNFAEGLVLKPDARCAGEDRPVIKRKIPEFDDDRFGEAEAWRPAHLGEAELASWVERLVSPARLASARSKVGTATAAVLDEVALDVALDLSLTFPDAWNRLDEAAQERLQAQARALAEPLVPGRRES
ncbi:MAG: RNA ligase [Myxococcales bacterium]|nr:RNA ligase [Myxococcales bacterium]